MMNTMSTPYSLTCPDLDTLTMERDDLDCAIAPIARYWTEIDDDLRALGGEQAAKIRRMRLDTAEFDYPRAAYWHDPESVDVIADAPYRADGGYDRAHGQVRGHLLDLYLPHAAIVSGGATLPVYIDVHGGGFCYGYKELNRNFCTHLAALGFAVFSLNYRPAPQTDLRGQLTDIQDALRWIRANLGRFPVNPDAVFLTGDSAGACLALLTMAIELDAGAAAAFGVPRPSGLPIAGGALISGVYDITESSPTRERLTDTLGPRFFAGLEAAQPFLSPATLVPRCPLPPLYLQTSSDDFIEAETLALATSLSACRGDFELHDEKVPSTRTLGHVFPVCMTWLEDSEQVLARMRRFVYRLAR